MAAPALPAQPRPAEAPSDEKWVPLREIQDVIKDLRAENAKLLTQRRELDRDLADLWDIAEHTLSVAAYQDLCCYRCEEKARLKDEPLCRHCLPRLADEQ